MCPYCGIQSLLTPRRLCRAGLGGDSVTLTHPDRPPVTLSSHHVKMSWFGGNSDKKMQGEGQGLALGGSNAFRRVQRPCEASGTPGTAWTHLLASLNPRKRKTKRPQRARKSTLIRIWSFSHAITPFHSFCNSHFVSQNPRKKKAKRP